MADVSLTDKDKEKDEVEIIEIIARRNNPGDEQPQNSSTWLVSFTDVIALMLTFFVLLYSMSSPDQEKWQKKLGVAPMTMNPYGGQEMQQGIHDTVNINRVDYEQANNLDYVEAILKEKIGAIDPNTGVRLGRANGKIEFMIDIDQAFTSRGRPRTEFINSFNKIAPIVNNMNNQVQIQSSYNPEKSMDSFNALQVIGRIFNSSGYKKPIGISLNGLGKAADQKTIRLILDTNTGRRVNR